MGNLILTKFYAMNSAMDVRELKDLRTKREKVVLSRCVADNISFSTDVFNRLMENIKSHVVYRRNGNKFPISFPIHYKGTTYSVASGGLHSTEKGVEFRSTEAHKIITCDIASMYPTCMINNGVAPAHLDADEFISILKQLTDERVKAKKTNKMLAEALKITINGIYGKTNSDTFWLEDAEAMLKVTVSGQLYLLMLVEMLETNGIHCISANTDGIECQVPHAKEDLYYRICNAWEKKTNFTLEFNEYEFYVKRHINSYVAIAKHDNWYSHNWRDFSDTPFGKLKTKGDFVTKPDYLRAHKHPIVSKAMNAYYEKGTPVEETIFNCDNIFDFCISKKSDKAFHIQLGETKLQRTNRFFISTSGEELYTVRKETTEKGKAGETTGIFVGFGVRILNEYKEETPFSEYDVNKMWYVSQAKSIISKIKRHMPDMFAFVEDYGSSTNMFPDIVIPTKEEVSPVKTKDVIEANRTRSMFSVDNKYMLVTEVNTTYSPNLKVYSLGKGTSGTLKIKKADFKKNPVRVGDVIFAHELEEVSKKKPDGTKNDKGKLNFVDADGSDYWVRSYEIITDFSGFKRKVIK
jgi:hypothetical protein